MELILCPLAVILALVSFVRKQTAWVMLSYFCCSLSMALSIFDINKRVATGDMVGVMDIYPTLANIYLIVLAFVTFMNVVAMIKKK